MPVLGEILKKIHDWQKTFSITDILDNYFLAIEVVGLFLRKILLKLKYGKGEGQTCEVFAIFSDYFDISLISKGPEDSIRKKKDSEHKDTQQIYFFN